MCRVLIRIQQFFVVCPHAGFDQVGKQFLLARNLLASGRIWLHIFFSHSLPVSFLSLSFFLHPTPWFHVYSCTFPQFFLIPHLFFFYLFYPSLLVSALTIFLKECWVVFPVCLSCHRYHQLFFTHILPRVSILPSWHKTNTDLGMSMSTQGRAFISGAQDTDLQCLNEVTPAVVEIRPKCVLGIKQ